jgi:hypothetical protein
MPEPTGVAAEAARSTPLRSDPPAPSGRPPPFRLRPPRRPRRRCGSSAAMSSHPVVAATSPARTAAASAHSSGLRRRTRSVSRSRSSGVRARRAIRCSRSLYFRRRRAASCAPRTRPSTDSSSMTAGMRSGAARSGAVGGLPLPPRLRSRSRDSLRGGSGTAGRLVQSKLKSGCVCSRASVTSASSGRRPTLRFGGDRNK